MIGCGPRGDSARPPHGTAPGPAPARTDLILGFEEALSHPPRVPGRLHVAGAVSSGQGLGDVCGGGTREPSVGAGRAPHSRRSGCFQSRRATPGEKGSLPFFAPGSVGVSYSTISLGVQALPGSAGGCGEGRRGLQVPVRPRHLGPASPPAPPVLPGTQDQRCAPPGSPRLARPPAPPASLAGASVWLRGSCGRRGARRAPTGWKGDGTRGGPVRAAAPMVGKRPEANAASGGLAQAPEDRGAGGSRLTPASSSHGGHCFPPRTAPAPAPDPEPRAALPGEGQSLAPSDARAKRG